MSSTDIAAIDPDRAGNADLMAACWELGYLGPAGGAVLDATYGLGAFWRAWTGDMPFNLYRNDLDPEKGHYHHDFTNLPWLDDTFDAVVFDPPYKLNGTPTSDPGGMDARYGVGDATRWQDRHALIVDGIVECARVLAIGSHLLVKCQAQVVSGAVRWQDRLFADHGERVCGPLVDRFDLIGGRPQPAGRRQVHARRNHSTLLVFRKAST